MLLKLYTHLYVIMNQVFQYDSNLVHVQLQVNMLLNVLHHVHLKIQYVYHEYQYPNRNKMSMVQIVLILIQHRIIMDIHHVISVKNDYHWSLMLMHIHEDLFEKYFYSMKKSNLYLP